MIESDASGEWEGGRAKRQGEGWRGEENAITGGANVGAQGEQVGTCQVLRAGTRRVETDPRK